MAVFSVRLWGVLGRLTAFLFSPVHGDFMDSNEARIGTTYPDNGTDWFFHTWGSQPITVTRVDGGAFSIQSFDATFYNNLFNGDASIDHNIQANGSFSVGGSISTIFTIDDLPSFETFTFGSGWTNLISLTLKVPSEDGRMGYDNIVLSPIPLPAALPLFATALSGMGLLGWRRKRKASASV